MCMCSCVCVWCAHTASISTSVCVYVCCECTWFCCFCFSLSIRSCVRHRNVCMFFPSEFGEIRLFVYLLRHCIRGSFVCAHDALVCCCWCCCFFLLLFKWGLSHNLLRTISFKVHAFDGMCKRHHWSTTSLMACMQQCQALGVRHAISFVHYVYVYLYVRTWNVPDTKRIMHHYFFLSRHFYLYPILCDAHKYWMCICHGCTASRSILCIMHFQW